MKYAIDKELKNFARLKMPANVKLLPAMNAVIKLFRCRSDGRVAVTEHITPGFDGASIRTLVIEPRERGGCLPCIVLFHGGGFMLRASGGHYQIAKWYAQGMPCKVVLCDYRLAPRFPFPVPVEDCCLTYQWTLDNAARLGIDADRVVLAGDSAGGDLAAAVALIAGDRGLPCPIGEMLIYPVTDRRMITPSMKKFIDTPVWDSRLSQMMWSAYLGGRQPQNTAYASPAEAQSLACFPAAYIEVAEFDSLRDEGITFAQRLSQSQIPVELHEIKGACHGYETMVKSRLVKAAMESRINWLKKVTARL